MLILAAPHPPPPFPTQHPVDHGGLLVIGDKYREAPDLLLLRRQRPQVKVGGVGSRHRRPTNSLLFAKRREVKGITRLGLPSKPPPLLWWAAWPSPYSSTVRGPPAL